MEPRIRWTWNHQDPDFKVLPEQAGGWFFNLAGGKPHGPYETKLTTVEARAAASVEHRDYHVAPGVVGCAHCKDTAPPGASVRS